MDKIVGWHGEISLVLALTEAQLEGDVSSLNNLGVTCVCCVYVSLSFSLCLVMNVSSQLTIK